MKPIATSETKQELRKSNQRDNNFELENLDISPGNTLRDRRRIEDLHSPTQDVVEVLQESPGARNRRKANEAHQVNFRMPLTENDSRARKQEGKIFND